VGEKNFPQKILIIKLSAIGDVIQTLPMMEALKVQYPQAQIDWLVEEDASDLLVGHPALTRVMVSRRKLWQKRLFQKGHFWTTCNEIKIFVRELRNVHYDWVIDNHGIFKSGIMVALSRGRRKIGFKPFPGIADEGSYLFTNERYQPLPMDRHALERYLDLIAQVGVSVEEADLKFSLPAGARDKAEKVLREQGLASSPLVIIHPMAKWATKQWPLENFARLADNLLTEGASLVFTGSLEDREAVHAILRQIQNQQRILNLAGKTDLKELAGLFSLADLVLTPDTGPMHLAAAVHAPLIALFGPTAPWRTGPYGDKHVILRKSLACSPCFKKECATLECMNSLTVEEVLEAAKNKLRGVGDSRIQGVKEDTKMLKNL
jgi:heptosyltransferase-1